MTTKEHTGIRDLTFSGWVRENLPDSNTGFLASDIDFYFFNYKTKKCMMLEVKTRKSDLKFWQKEMYNTLDQALKIGLFAQGWEWKGCHLLQFENTSFEDGKAYFDRKEITKEKLIEKLSI